MTRKVSMLLDAMANPNSTYARNLQRWETICRLNNEKARAIVSNAVKLAASVGVDHLVPRDVATAVAALLVFVLLKRAMQSSSGSRTTYRSAHEAEPESEPFSGIGKPEKL
ncbi:hypothetical protein Gpo141_00004163 [Globisporangium polare]